MKKLKSLFATLALLLCTISASAEDFSVDGIYYRITDSEKLTVEVTYRGSKYNSYSNEYTGDVVIPEKVIYASKTYAVTSIGRSAFYECSSLTSVTIPDGVTSIDEYTFEDCCSLTSIIIPNSVTSIGYSAFEGCSSLTSVHISDIAAWCNIKFNNYLSNPLYYAKHLYMNGKEITELKIPDGVTSIGNYVFYNCLSLTSVTIPDGVTSIGYMAFYGCSRLTSVTIPDGVTSIGSIAFYGCSSLTSVTIPDGVTSIGYHAFNGCSNLTSVTIPNSVTSIGLDAFDGTAWYNNQPDGVVYAGKVAYKYKGIMPSNTSIELAEGTLGIAGYAFSDCISLISVTIPNSVTSIGNYAFPGSGLTSVTIPESITQIEEGTFSCCSNLKTVILPKKLYIIRKQAFQGCSSLKSITIPDSVGYIYPEVFHGCI